MHRADVDDTPTLALLDHLSRSELAAMKYPPESDRPGFLNIFNLKLQQGLADAVSRVVNEDIHSTQNPDGFLDHSLVLNPVSDITLKEDGSLPQAFNLADNFESLFPMASRVDRYVRSEARQFKGDGTANAPRCSGNNGNLVLQCA